jgi:DNA-binding transcriptional LysR family regulator
VRSYRPRVELRDCREPVVKLATFDLNLLITFDALISEQNVTRAGQKVGLSQPAMSAALNRLRYLLKDELFVRSGNTMRPTARALEIAHSVSSILQQIETSLAPQSFDPTRARKTFRLAFNDLGAALFLPPLMQQIGSAAPNINFEIMPADEDRAIELLDSGKVDVAAGLYTRQLSRLQSTKLYQAPFVCALRRDHPDARKTLSMEQFANLSRISIAQRGDPGENIDHILRKHGLRQQIAIVVPHYLAVPFIVAQTNLVAVLPLKLVKRFEKSEHIRVVKTEFCELSAPIHLTWTAATANDPANRWLRSMIVGITGQYQLDKWLNFSSTEFETVPV